MHLLYRRYSRSGVAPLWFYIAMAAAFVGLAVWAAVARDWLTLGLALAMVPVAIAGRALMRRVSESTDVRTNAHDDERRTP